MTKYILLGPSLAGKTTLCNLLKKEFDLKSVDIIPYVLDYIKENSLDEIIGEDLKIPYQRFINDLPNKNFEIVEIATDWPDEILPNLVTKIAGNNLVVIYIACRVDKCLQRNRQRPKELQVPESTIRRQCQWTYQSIKDICDKLGVKLLFLDSSSGDLKETYRQLREVISSPF